MSDQPESSWEDIQRRGAEALAADGEPPLDKAKGSTFDRHSTDRSGPVGPGMPVAGSGADDMRPPVGPTELHYADRETARKDAEGWPSADEIMRAAQDSSLACESMFGGVRPYLDEPDWPRSGREAGAWAAGVMISLVRGVDTIYVRLKPEHVDGAAGALIDAGYRVERYSRSEVTNFASLGEWQGPSVTLAVARTA